MKIPSKDVVATLWHEPLLRNLFVVSILVAVLFPLYESWTVYPEFRRLIMEFVEHDAKRKAVHLTSYPGFSEDISQGKISPAFIEEIDKIRHDFGLEKVKVFSRNGAVIFSTEQKDIGKINRKSYFHEIVAKGQPFSKMVKKDQKTMDGHSAPIAVVESYVPVIQGGEFVGAFEIYYNVTYEEAEINGLFSKSTTQLFILSLLLCGLLAVVIFRLAQEIHSRSLIQYSLKESENHIRTLTEAAQDAMIEADREGRITFWNPAAEKLFGWRREEAIGRNVVETVMPKRFQMPARNGLEKFARQGQGQFIGRTVEVVGMNRDGVEFPVEISTAAFRRNEGWSAVGMVRDISRRKEAEAMMRLGTNIIEHALEGVLVTDPDGVIEMVNPAFTRLSGYEVEDVQGKKPSILKSGRHDALFYADMWRVLLETGKWQGEVWNRHKSGALYLEWLSISSIWDADGKVTNYVGIASDITRRKMFEERLEQLAFYDGLTGVPNRMLFQDRLHSQLNQAKRYGHQLAIFFLDLDYFKQVNDQYGHDVGDLLLKEVAQRLLGLLRKEDTVARLGGDEFAIILRRVVQLPDDAALVAGKVVRCLTTPFHINSVECRIGTSIGISLFPGDGATDEMLVKLADEAMYQAKQAGRCRYCFHGKEPVALADVEVPVVEGAAR
ncbi:diguanylate cyclase domain-containing protein [Magnetococcales bacterium HHB-1]